MVGGKPFFSCTYKVRGVGSILGLIVDNFFVKES